MFDGIQLAQESHMLDPESPWEVTKGVGVEFTEVNECLISLS